MDGDWANNITKIVAKDSTSTICSMVMADDIEVACGSQFPPDAKTSNGYGVWHGLRIQIRHSDGEDSVNDDLAGTASDETDEDITISSFKDVFESVALKMYLKLWVL